MNIGTLTATLGIDSRGLLQARRDMDKWERSAKRSVDAVNRKLKQTGASMKRFGRNMSMYVSAPIIAVGAASFKMQKDFEFSMTKMISLVGVARGQVDEWGEDIIKLAPELGKAPKELADALFFVTSAGIRGAEAMDVLKASAQASAAGLGETKVVADLVTSAMNAYGKEVLNAELATDILVNTVREGKAEASELASSIGMVIPVASNLGVSFDQVGAAVAAMTRTGTKAQTAAMQLRQILAAILKPASQSKQALLEMGTSATKLRKTLREDGLITVLSQLNDLQKEYGEETLATVFPNIRALAGVLDIVGANAADNVKIFDSLTNSNGLLGKAFGEVSKTIEFKYQQAIAQAKTTLVELGKTVAEDFLPILKGLADKIAQVSEWFKSLSESQRHMVVRIAALTATIGPLLIILGFLVGNVLPGLISIGYGAVRMFNALKLAVMTNPFTAIVGVLALVATGLIAFRKRAEEAEEAQKGLNEAIKKGNDLMANTHSIEERIGLLNQLNERQLEDLKLNIQAQLAAEEDYTVSLKEELKKRLEADKNLQNLREVLRGTEEKTAREALAYQIHLRKKYIAEDLEKQYEGNRKRLKALQEYLNQVKAKLKEFQDTKVDTSVRTPAPDKLTPIAPTAVGFSDVMVKDTQAIHDYYIALGQLQNQYKAYGDELSYVTGLQNLYKTTIDALLKEGIKPHNEFLQDMIDKLGLTAKQVKALREEMMKMGDVYVDLNGMAERFLTDMISNTAQALGKMVAGQGDWQDFFASILSDLGSFLIQMGEAIVLYGVAMDAFKEALGEPWVAIVAGAALIVFGALVQSLAAQGMATGGTVTDGGAFMVGERGPELVTLPRGAAVTSNRDLLSMKSGGGIPKIITLKAKGKDLYATMDLQNLINNSY